MEMDKECITQTQMDQDPATKMKKKNVITGKWMEAEALISEK